MEPTTPNAPTPNSGQHLVELIRTQRQNAGSFFVVLSIVLLGVAVFLALKAFRTPAADPSIGKDADKAADKMFPDGMKDKDKPPFELANVKRGEYNAGWLGCLMACLLTGAAGAWLMVGTPAATDSEQRKEVRVMLLAVGGLLGAVLIVFGLVLFYLWSDSLTRWLDKSETREARWVLYPLLMIVTGSGLVFLAIQPARAEERHDPVIRKLVYGSNFALTALLLVVVLVVANVVFALKVPNKLDTTETGFYTLSKSTEDLLARLDPPVTAYAMLPDTIDRNANDIRQLMLSCQDVSGGRFKVKFLDEVANKTELASLQRKYPQLELALKQQLEKEDEFSGAVLLVSGEGDGRAAVIPNREFSTSDGRDSKFTGESRLFKELAFLADNQTRSVVYFTQSNGELSLAGGTTPERSATRFRDYLERNYLDVRPLAFPLENPNVAVPDDAAVVIVADPRTPFSEPAIAALRKFMNNPAKKGKLIVLAGANAGPDGKMLKTGLEPFLLELNVRLSNQFLFSFQHPQQQIPPNSAIVGFSKAAEQNPILQSIIKVAPALQFLDPREVEPLPGANPTLQTTDLMLSDGYTWIDDQQPTDLEASIEELRNSAAIRQAKQLSRKPRYVAVIVSERGTSRAAVFGTAGFVSDRIGSRSRSQTTPLSFELIGVTIDWLRDKQTGLSSDITAKPYSNYRFPQPATVDNMRLRYLPLGLALLIVAGLGAGVWMIRRK